MPYKDPEERRKYFREWQQRDRKQNIEKYRKTGRKSAKTYRKNSPDLYQKRLETARDRYAKLRFRCKKHRFELRLTLEEYSEILKTKTCHYCDMPLNKTGSGLDRINNDPFYSVDTVVPCCVRCNRVFNIYFTYEQKMILAKAIKECDKMPSQPKNIKQNLRVEESPQVKQGQLFH